MNPYGPSADAIGRFGFCLRRQARRPNPLPDPAAGSGDRFLKLELKSSELKMK